MNCLYFDLSVTLTKILISGSLLDSQFTACSDVIMVLCSRSESDI